MLLGNRQHTDWVTVIIVPKAVVATQWAYELHRYALWTRDRLSIVFKPDQMQLPQVRGHTIVIVPANYVSG